MRRHIMNGRLLGCLIGCGALGCGGTVAASPANDGGTVDSNTDSGVLVDSGAPVDSESPSDAPWGVPPDGGPWSTVCPANPPTKGGACSPEGVQCEYGDGWWNVSCDTVLECMNGTWSNYTPGSEACLPAPGPNPSGCPINPGAIGSESACPTPGLTCWYGQGANCLCGSPFLDAGSEPKWGCTPEPGCPNARPRLGASCTTSPICLYAGCFGEQCKNGVWLNVPVGC